MSDEAVKNAKREKYWGSINSRISKSLCLDNYSFASSGKEVLLCAIEETPDYFKPGKHAGMPFDAVVLRMDYESAKELAEGLKRYCEEREAPVEAD